MSDRTRLMRIDAVKRTTAPPTSTPVTEPLGEPLAFDPSERRSRVRRIGSALWRRLLDPFSFSRLSSRIVALNVVALAVLVGGVLYLSQFRAGLIDLRIDALTTEADLIAVTVAEAAGEPQNQTYNRIIANEVLRRLALPTGLRAQLYDRTGRLTGDTRSMTRGAVVVEVEPHTGDGDENVLFARFEDIYDRLVGMFLPPLEMYRETPPAGVSEDEEVYLALNGDRGSAQRVNAEDELILSVAVPVTRVKTVMGALVLSTEGGDIDEIVHEERVAVLQVFAVAAAVTVLVSMILAQTIARPIHALAQAADDGGARENGLLDPQRIDIPNFTDRRDEIGHLSGAMRRMTDALYQRIDAIESFAADVAHEIKNPLTSLRSAVETLRRAPQEEARLLAVIENDVRRLDRLVTDIANASRLDAELVREDRQMFELRSLIVNVVSIADLLAAEKGVAMRAQAPPATVHIRGMEARLAQVLHNLLDNALSFSAAGDELQLTVRAATHLGRPAVLIQVIDEGPGIPPENVESIFERFYSERPDTEDFGKHSGLGLSICRQIVEAHAGRIWAENRSDRRGAIFSVLLPR